ncbi:MAG TPA: 30S ribosomal protein S12 methylthiotransferase RimO [Candidatus Omnitrophota bacterium]|nr:30S ribosomal protein S12 methylthiotransferase RimO [Candidatus Omnitrophota bacterium]
MKACFVSLGCPKNLADTEVLMGKLASAGYDITTKEKAADIFIVNTCAFLKSARDEAFATIRKLERTGKPVYVAGCLPEYIRKMPSEARQTKFGFRNSDFGFNTIDSIGLFDCHTPRIKATPPWTAYVKISEGCNNHCSYCLIPKIRGKLRHRQPDDILAEVKMLAKRGVKEIIFIGQDTTAYPGFASLLKRAARIKGVKWIRIMYANPKTLDKSTINALKTVQKIVKYIDLPIQHINDKILRSMNRPKPDGKGIINLISSLRRGVPGIAVRSSLIVGFPGETEKVFNHLLEFVQWAKFERLGVFEYSREKGTPAAQMRGQVPGKVKRLRFHKLMSLQNRISREMNRKLIGKTFEVLYEGNGFGRTVYDAPAIDCSVRIMPRSAWERLSPGEFVNCKITGSGAYAVTGRVTSP